MNRRTFMKTAGASTVLMTTRELSAELTSLGNSDTMPSLFIGHGSPMNAIEDNEYVRGWKQLATELPTPKAILVISAHWLTHGTKVLSATTPRTIHDFYGFPQQMYDIQYAAKGSPKFAAETKALLTPIKTIDLDESWGFDHGTWSILLQLFPSADIPVYQLSIDVNETPAAQYELATALKALRKKGVLIIGSGNIVHNLRMMSMNMSTGFDWAKEFDSKIISFIESRTDRNIIDYESLGTAAKLAVPTNDHFLPLLYTLGASSKEEPIKIFNAKTDLGSMSMTSVRIG